MNITKVYIDLWLLYVGNFQINWVNFESPYHSNKIHLQKTYMDAKPWLRLCVCVHRNREPAFHVAYLWPPGNRVHDSCSISCSILCSISKYPLNLWTTQDSDVIVISIISFNLSFRTKMRFKIVSFKISLSLMIQVVIVLAHSHQHTQRRSQGFASVQVFCSWILLEWYGDSKFTQFI